MIPKKTPIYTKWEAMIKKAINRKEILSGTVFGEWTVLEQITDKDSKGRYISLLRVKCSCGTEKLVRKSGVVEGRSKACKPCSTRLKSKNPGFENLGGAQLWFLRHGAEKRNLPYTVTGEYLWNLLVQQNFECALTGVPLVIEKVRTSNITASVDRIDNKQGYVEGNVRWVHKRVNIMRMDMTDDELLEWCSRIVEYRNIHKKI